MLCDVISAMAELMVVALRSRIPLNPMHVGVKPALKSACVCDVILRCSDRVHG
jgi:hypothetical protein